MRAKTLKHKFVTAIPETLEEGTLYVSLEYRTVIHKCCCGCGQEIVTPLGPTDWKVISDGVSVSLNPSIGNWRLPCRSHYWIDRNTVVWAAQWSDEEVAAVQNLDRISKARHFGEPVKPIGPTIRSSSSSKSKRSIWERLTEWIK
ncbi:MAG TPA: DUF6527 family protein [Candidatus Binatia bacterium]|nr:DUF6527 family protein [Candidatus Binatia bacterium]